MLESVIGGRLSCGSFAPDSRKVNESRNVSFTLAHLSDVHLAHLKMRMVLKHFQGKRVIGAFSWFLNRRSLHRLSVADAIQASIIEANPDHVALTGDLVNIAAWPEFVEATSWVERFGPADRLSIVPGNHDAYVLVPWNEGLAQFAPWMTSDRQVTATPEQRFPYVRMRRTTALIGVNSGLPQSYRLAAGTLGTQQLRDLRNLLSQLGHQGFYRVVMIHHPPLPGFAIARKALTDAAELKAVLAEEGCELVLHGHNHVSMLHWLETKSGAVPIIGVASASSHGDTKHEAAAWNLYHIRRQQGRWLTDMTPHRWNAKSETVGAQPTVTLSPP
jgi:3',5'-cyclic AMP phosphodiesterase CpdA